MVEPTACQLSNTDRSSDLVTSQISYQANPRSLAYLRNCLVPCIRADRTCSGVATKLCIIIHNFTHQLLNHLLADRTILAASQLCHSLGNCCNHFVRINGVWFAGCGRMLSKKIVDQVDHHAMKTWSLLVISLF